MPQFRKRNGVEDFTGKLIGRRAGTLNVAGQFSWRVVEQAAGGLGNPVSTWVKVEQSMSGYLHPTPPSDLAPWVDEPECLLDCDKGKFRITVHSTDGRFTAG